MKSDLNNLISINIARGLAALSVFVYHYGIGPTLAKYTGFLAFNWIGTPGAKYGVTLFFVISGFCIHGSEWRRLQKLAGSGFNARAYFERRARRIYPVYVVALLFSLLLSVLRSQLPPPADIALHAFLLHGFSPAYFNTINLVLWTISIEAFFYLTYPLWLVYRVRAGLWRAFLAGTAISFASCLATAAFFYPYSLPARWFFLNTWGGWLLGALMAETMEAKPCLFRSWKWWSLGAVAWWLGAAAEARDFFHGHLLLLQFPIRIYLSAWPLSALVLSEKYFASATGPLVMAVRALSWIGLSSYSVYLLHEPLIELRNSIQDAITLGGWRLTFQISWFFVILAVCWLSYRYLEMRFIKRARKPVLDVASALPITSDI